MKLLNNIILLLLMIGSVLFSFITKPELIFVQFISIAYLVVIYAFFAKTQRKFAYFSSFLFSIISLGNRHHYYLAFIIYILILCKQIFLEKSIQINILKRKKFNKYNIFLGVFIIYMFISLIWALDKSMGIKYIIKYFISITMMLLFIIENNTETELNDTLKFFNYLFLGVIFIGTLEILGMDFGLPNHFADMGITHKYVRIIPVTFFHNPNNYAVFLVMGLITNINNLLENKKDKYFYMSFISFILIVINMIFTRSRTSLIVAILCILFIPILGVIKRKDKEFYKKSIAFFVKYSLLGFLIFSIISILPGMSYYCGKFAKIPIISEIQKIIFSNGIISDSQEIPIVIGASGSDNIRITLIYNVLQGVLKEFHIFGFGVGNIGKYLATTGNTHGILAVHCYWLELLGDFGVFMFIYAIYIYIHIAITMFFKFKKCEFEIKKYYIIALSMLFAWSMLVFGPSSVITFTPFWISLGITYAIFNQYFIINKEC